MKKILFLLALLLPLGFTGCSHDDEENGEKADFDENEEWRVINSDCYEGRVKDIRNKEGILVVYVQEAPAHASSDVYWPEYDELHFSMADLPKHDYIWGEIISFRIVKYVKKDKGYYFPGPEERGYYFKCKVTKCE